MHLTDMPSASFAIYFLQSHLIEPACQVTYSVLLLLLLLPLLFPANNSLNPFKEFVPLSLHCSFSLGTVPAEFGTLPFCSICKGRFCSTAYIIASSLIHKGFNQLAHLVVGRALDIDKVKTTFNEIVNKTNVAG